MAKTTIAKLSEETHTHTHTHKQTEPKTTKEKQKQKSLFILFWFFSPMSCCLPLLLPIAVAFCDQRFFGWGIFPARSHLRSKARQNQLLKAIKRRTI